MTIRINKRHVFCFFLMALMALVLIRYGFQINIPRTSITAVVILIALLGGKNEVLTIALCCIPLHNGLNFHVSVVVCAVIYVLKSGKKMRFNLSALLIIGMIMWELLHCFAAEFNLTLFLTSISPLIFLLIILNSDVIDVGYAFVARVLSAITICVSVALLLYCLIRANYDIIVMFANLQRLGSVSDDTALFGSEVNPNSLGVVNVLAATSLLQIRHMGCKRKIDGILITLLLIFSLLTASRTALICLIIMTISLLVGQRGKFVQKLRYGVAVIIIAAGTIAVYMRLFPESFAFFLSRFEDSDVTGGRMNLFMDYNNYMKSNLQVIFLGVGLMNFGEKVTVIYNMAHAVPHNCIQEVIVAWGIPGLILVTLLIAVMIAQSKKYGTRKTLLNYIPLIILISKSMAGQFITSGYTMLALAFAYLSLCQDFTPTDRLDNTSL